MVFIQMKVSPLRHQPEARRPLTNSGFLVVMIIAAVGNQV
jgi:hypothetical protein